jgi:phage tail-like protein
MSAHADSEYVVPFTTFNFLIEVSLGNAPGRAVCSANFSECDGLEATIETKTIREGGNNGTQIRLAGPLGYAMLTLKRGMTGDFGLWQWFRDTAANPRLRADARIVLLGADRRPRMSFAVYRCMPVKIKAPAFNAKEGGLAIEEMQIAYESFDLETEQ